MPMTQRRNKLALKSKQAPGRAITARRQAKDSKWVTTVTMPLCGGFWLKTGCRAGTITDRHNQISPALVLVFDDVKHPVVPLREYRWAEYLPLLPLNKQMHVEGCRDEKE